MIYKKLKEIREENIKLQKDTTGYNYKYATLDQIQNKIGPVLNKKNITMYHYCDGDYVITKLIDLDDETYIESSIKINREGPQEKGSEITYFRRYNLLMLLDLETEDDNGESAQGGQKQEISDNKPWFNNPELEKLKANKDKFNDGEEAIEKISKKYKINKEIRQKIKDLYSN